MFRPMLLALALPLAALAQIQVSFIPESGPAQVIPLAGSQDVGTVAAGTNVSLHFQILNTGQNPTPIGTVNVLGFGFAIPDPPPMHYTLASGATLDFHIAFAPVTPADYPAVLGIDSFSARLTGHAIAIPKLSDSTGASWQAGDVIAFPKTQIGNSASKTLTVTNPWPGSLPITLSMSGDGFQSTLPGPFSLAQGQAQSFQITFQPATSGANSGKLLINGQSFGLTGEAFQPAMPAASVLIDGNGVSGKQMNLTVQLASAAPAPGSGTLSMTFVPAAAGTPDDPAIRFLDNGLRSINVQIANGATSGQFGSGANCAFQTGTTAGAITFTLSVGGELTQATLVVGAAPPAFDIATAHVSGNGIDVTLAGFDNTHATSSLSFTFYDTAGNEISGGVVQADVATKFQQFFAQYASQSGGLFQLDAQFPVTGTATQLGAVAVTATNNAGTSAPIRLPISY
jgi:hypothetical protein